MYLIPLTLPSPARGEEFDRATMPQSGEGIRSSTYEDLFPKLKTTTQKSPRKNLASPAMNALQRWHHRRFQNSDHWLKDW